MKDQVFTGGIRTGAFNATWPFGRMNLTDEELIIRTLGAVTRRSTWQAVARAERVVGGLLRSPGVRLTWVEGDQLVFWSFKPDAVLNALKARGVEIVDSAGKPPKVWLGT